MKKILIVDDDKNNRHLIKYTLDEYEVSEAESGMEALQILKDLSPDLILLDQRMPEMDGLMTLEAINKINLDFKCIMITAEGTVQLAIEALKKGALDFVIKPFDPIILEYTIKKAIRYVELNKKTQQIENERKKELLEYKSQFEKEVLKRTHQVMQEKIRAEKANQAKSEFLANISHELRTPLHGILSFAKFGLDRIEWIDKKKLKKYFSEIKLCGENLLDLLNELLDLSKLETGKIVYKFQETQLSLAIKKIITESKSLCKEKEIIIQFTEPNFNDTAAIDIDKIIQVMQNLLSNAIKFSQNKKKIFVEIAQDNQYFIVSIIDEGIGIPETEYEIIFDAFVQSSKSKTGAGGTGLGLSIAKNIIFDHHGTIWAEPNPKGGSIFRFQIPKNQPPVENKQIISK